jgi:hypothetical protein
VAPSFIDYAGRKATGVVPCGPMSDLTTSEVVGFVTLALLLALLLVLLLRAEAVRLLDWGRMMDPRTELLLISLLATFCGGLAWRLGHELFAAAFFAAAVAAGSQAYRR